MLTVAKTKGFYDGENPVTAIHDAGVLPKVAKSKKQHAAMSWQDVPAFYADVRGRSAMAAQALRMTWLCVL